MKNKYIKFEYGFAIFSIANNHADVARVFQRGSGDPISAGFVSVGDDNKMVCYGESISLKLKSLPEDSKDINKYINE